MLLSLRAEEQKIVEREDVDDGAEDLLETIDKQTVEHDGGLFFSFAGISQGIHAGDVKKIQNAGIDTCKCLDDAYREGFSEAKVDKICESAEKIVNSRFITGIEAMLRSKSVICITTGSQTLNELLGGGTETQAITEAFGVSRSGKTQLAYTLFVTTQVAERFGMDPGAIIYARASTSEHQYNFLLSLAAKVCEEPFRFLIVDSVIALFRVEYNGRGELAGRQQTLAQMLSRLLKTAEEFNVAVYMTNQVVDDLGGAVFISDPEKPAGGDVLAHLVTIRLIFRKGKGEQRVCKLFKAPDLPKAEAKSILSLHIDRWRPDLSTVLTVHLMVYGDP
ncbi:hypothetical protein ACJRO7_010446 [Eucalyptus globulus]|uniref:Uncharacterized protein n=1 Tax=Eucalyptus globulus TaxID=34317 RepID=A0ABD3LCT7_EUCGL